MMAVLSESTQVRRIMKPHTQRKKKVSWFRILQLEKNPTKMKARYRHFQTDKNWRNLSPADFNYRKANGTSLSCREIIPNRFCRKEWKYNRFNMLENIRNSNISLFLYRNFVYL